MVVLMQYLVNIGSCNITCGKSIQKYKFILLWSINHNKCNCKQFIYNLLFTIVTYIFISTNVSIGKK